MKFRKLIEGVETDSLGNQLTPEQSRYFARSKVRDTKGRLLVCYHRTNSEFDTFDKGYFGSGAGTDFGYGFYFSAIDKDWYGDIKKECYLNITNPFYLDVWSIEGITRFFDLINLPQDDVDYYLKDALSMVDTVGGAGFVNEFIGQNELTNLCIKNSYDGIIVGDIMDGEIIAFEPEQICGVNNRSITESISYETDNLGNELSTEQSRYFKNSKVRDRNGNLLVVYHGTYNSFDSFGVGDIGFHFGSYKSAVDRKGFKTHSWTEEKSWLVGKYYLNITNPFVCDFDYESFDGVSIAVVWLFGTSYDGLVEFINDGVLGETYIPREFSDAKSVEIIKDVVKRFASKYDNWSSIPRDAEPNVIMRNLFMSKGFDGIEYYNSFEDSGSTSYVAFNPEQIKSTTNKTPTSSKNLNEDALIPETNAYVDFIDELHSKFNSMSTEQIISFLNINQRNDLDTESPMFILPNGKFVSVQETLDTNGADTVELTHQSICECFAWRVMDDLNYDEDTFAEIVDQDWRLERELGDLLTELTYKLGWARINCGTKAVDRRFYSVLPNEVTNKQWWSLEHWLEWGYDHNKSDVLVFVTDSAIAKKFKMNDFAPIFPEDIIKNIRRFYSSGRFYESISTDNGNEDILLHGHCDKWCEDNFKPGDEIFVFTQLHSDWGEEIIDGQDEHLIHSLIFRNGKYIDASGEYTDIYDLMGNFDEDPDDCYFYRFRSINDFKQFLNSTLNFNELRKDLTESLQRLASNAFITDSPYQIRDLLMNKPKLYRILYDRNIDMYMIGDGWDVIHWDLIEAAYKQGYYHKMEEFIDEIGTLDNYVEFGEGGQFLDDEEIESYLIYMVFSPDDEEFMLGQDGYQFRYQLPFGVMFTRDSYLEDCDLYNVVKRNITINEEKKMRNLIEGVWSLPDNQRKVDIIKRLFKKEITADDIDKVKDILYNVLGSDELFDSFDSEEDIDYRYNIAGYLRDFLDNYSDKIDKELVDQLEETISSFDRMYKKSVKESYIHTNSSGNPCALICGSALKVGDSVYDDKSGHKLDVIEVEEMNSYSKYITFNDTVTGKTEQRHVGNLALFELAGEGDEQVEVDDDIEIEWHPIDDYFDGNI